MWDPDNNLTFVCLHLHCLQLSSRLHIMPEEGHSFVAYNFKLADACVVCAELVRNEGKLCKGLLIYVIQQI